MDYQKFRPVTKPSYKQKTPQRNNFVEQSYNYVNRTKTTKISNTNTQNYSYSQSQNIPQGTSNSVFFNDQTRSIQDCSENYTFSNKTKIIQTDTSLKVNLLIIQLNLFHQMMRKIIIKIINASIQTKDIVLIALINQIFLSHEQIRQPRAYPTSNNYIFRKQNPVNTQSYQPNQTHNENLLPYYLQQHEITKNQRVFFQIPKAAESLQMTMNPYLMGGSSISSNKTLMVFTGKDPEYSVEDYLNVVAANFKYNFKYRT